MGSARLAPSQGFQDGLSGGIVRFRNAATYDIFAGQSGYGVRSAAVTRLGDRYTERLAVSELKNLFGALLDAGFHKADLSRALDAAVADQQRRVVYFAERHGLVKIGTTADLRSRIHSLNRGDCAIPGMTVSPVHLLAVMPGGRPVERALHQTFSRLRFDGEWFLLDEPLVGFIRSIAASDETHERQVQDALDRAHREAQIVRRVGTVRANLLADVRAVFRDGEQHVSWHHLAQRLSQTLPHAYGGLTSAVLSAEVRAFGIRSVNGKRNGSVRKGVKLVDLESALVKPAASGRNEQLPSPTPPIS